MVRAHGPRGYDLAARLGDGWSSYGGAGVVTMLEKEFWVLLTEQSQQVTRVCERA